MKKKVEYCSLSIGKEEWKRKKRKKLCQRVLKYRSTGDACTANVPYITLCSGTYRLVYRYLLVNKKKICTSYGAGSGDWWYDRTALRVYTTIVIGKVGR